MRTIVKVRHDDGNLCGTTTGASGDRKWILITLHWFDEDGLEDFDYDEDGLEDSNVDLEKAVVGPDLRLNFTEVGHVHFIITTTCSTYLLHSTIMSFGFFLHLHLHLQ